MRVFTSSLSSEVLEWCRGAGSELFIRVGADPGNKRSGDGKHPKVVRILNFMTCGISSGLVADVIYHDSFESLPLMKCFQKWLVV
jgi:hypothetical protein